MKDSLIINSIFSPGKNCWRIGEARFARLLIDSYNYYGALHEAICNAKHSVFVLGWDIDSRIQLMRGKDAQAVEPVTFFDLICRRARENPELQIYLNRWDYSIFFMSQREPFWVRKWQQCNLPNIHVCLDGVIPLAACHHQKVVVIDDEIAFWGGMDVALGRWDKRQHFVDYMARSDPSGLPNPKKKTHYGPYHDIQAVVAGPIVESFAELVRTRWKKASNDKPIPIQSRSTQKLPGSWPLSFEPQFRNVTMVLARTIPPMPQQKAVDEVARLFIDEIGQAEKFIYIENQYLACEKIAEALNLRLQEKPNLRVLIVTCGHPQGIFERKAMWGGRVIFRDILKRGGVEERFALVYPASKQHGEEKSIHIHSKLMIIDDKYLRLGSSNIANRSMGMDTEFDVTIIGDKPETRRQIEAIRNDLIREHCGRTIDNIQAIIDKGLPVSTFIDELKTSRQHFRALNDEPYRKEKFVSLARALGDPGKPIIPMQLTHILSRKKERRFATSFLIFGLIVLLLLGALSLIWQWEPIANFINPDSITRYFKDLSSSKWAFVDVILLYTLGSIAFFPITAMTGAAIVVFGPYKGVLISFTGAMLGAIIGFYIGRLIGKERLKNLFGTKITTLLKKIGSTGPIGISLIRLLPIAPYPLVNMVFGIANVSKFNYIVGTILGLIPGKLAMAFAGDGLIKIIKNPDSRNLIYFSIAITVWIGTMVVAQKFAKRWQLQRQTTL